MNDVNVSSPVLAKTKGLEPIHYEFGRLIESRVFGASVDWIKSNKRMSKDFVQNFMDAIKNNQELPDAEDLPGVIRRGSPLLMAIDYCTDKDYF